MDIQSFFSGMGEFFKLISHNPLAVIFSVFGFLLIVVAAVLAYKIATKETRDMPRGLIPIFFICFIFGVGFPVTGPSISLLSVHIEKLPSAQAFANLKINSRVYWLIRLVTFDPTRNPGLEIGELPKIGPKEHQWTFVADNKELRGYTVERAVRVSGGTGRDATMCPLSSHKKIRSISDMDKASNDLLSIFGARVFLTRNWEVRHLAGRYLVDFEEPYSQVIPDIGAIP